MPASPSKRRAAGAPPTVCALAVGGLDPGGGAGIAADLRAFGAAGVFGCAAIAVVTIQSTGGLRAVRPIAARDVVAQIDEVARYQRVGAIKTGALGTAENARAVARWIARHAPETPLVVDPVIAPTLRTRAPALRGAAPRGARAAAPPPSLLDDDGVDALRRALLPRTTLVTANAPEAAAILGVPVVTADDARRAARSLRALGPRAALVKGGHVAGGDGGDGDEGSAVDWLALDDDRVLAIAAPRLRLPPVHGGGCLLASLIAGRLARGASIESAVRWSKRVHHAALARPLDVGGPLRVLVPRAAR